MMPSGRSRQYLAFISYSHEDESWANQLYRDLIDRKGIPEKRIFIDEDRLKPGTLWKQGLREALTSSCYLIVLWSSKAQKSSWVQQELFNFDNSIDPPGAEFISIHRRMILILLDQENEIYRDNQMITTLKKANAYDPANPTIDKLLKENKGLWEAVVDKVYEKITADASITPVPLVVLATTRESLEQVDFAVRPKFSGFTRTLNDLLGNTIEIPTREELIDRYHVKRSEWRPIVGNNATVSELLINLRDEINRRSKSPPIRWEPVDDDFWENEDDARAIADSLASGLALIVVDPVSLYDPDVHFRLQILREQGCFDNENAVFLFLSPFQMQGPGLGFRDLIRDAARSVFNDYYLPGVRKMPYARCSVNFGDEMGMMRPVMATIKNYFYQTQQKQGPVQMDSVNGRPT